MRRNVGIALLAAVVVLTAVEASAQRFGDPQEEKYLRIPHRFTLFADLGIGVPTGPGPFKDAWNVTFPISGGIGYSVVAWMDVNFVASYAKFSLNDLEAKRQIAFLGITEAEGGDITTIRYLGTVRFLAVPNARFNPYTELGLGYFKTSADDLIVTGREPNNPIERSFTNTMEPVSGLSVNVGVGAQYALNERWSTYTEFTWTVNQNGDFAPSNLLLPENGTPIEGDGSQNMVALLVGIMIRM